MDGATPLVARIRIPSPRSTHCSRAPARNRCLCLREPPEADCTSGDSPRVIRKRWSAWFSIDPTHEERLFTMFKGETVAIASLTAEQLRSTVHAGTTSEDSPEGAADWRTVRSTAAGCLQRQRIVLDERLIASYPDSVPFEVVITAGEKTNAPCSPGCARNDRPIRIPSAIRPLVVLSRGIDTSPERDASFAALAVDLTQCPPYRRCPRPGMRFTCSNPAR